MAPNSGNPRCQFQIRGLLFYKKSEGMENANTISHDCWIDLHGHLPPIFYEAVLLIPPCVPWGLGNFLRKLALRNRRLFSFLGFLFLL